MEEEYLNIKTSNHFCSYNDYELINVILDNEQDFNIFKTQYIQNRFRRIAKFLKAISKVYKCNSSIVDVRNNFDMSDYEVLLKIKYDNEILDYDDYVRLRFEALILKLKPTNNQTINT